MSVGLAWDLLGPTGAFLVITLWCATLWLSIYALPPPLGQEETPPGLRDWRELAPRLDDYRDALRLIALPAVAFVVAATFGRIAALSDFLFTEIKQRERLLGGQTPGLKPPG